MTETLEKIQTIIKESKIFALLSKENCEDFRLLAREALKQAFSENNFEIISLGEQLNFQKKWKAILPEAKNNSSPQKTSIRIPKNQYKIKELNYENDENFLNLIITVENGEISKEAVVFEPVLPKADAVFCFFEPAETETFAEFEKQIQFPPKEKIIFLTSNGITFAEKITQIIKNIFPKVLSSPQISTLLFASLIMETNNFIRPVSQEVLRFGSEVLSLGADKEAVKKILNEEKTISFGQLLGRALARTHIDETSDASWTFLSQKDLEKTGNLNSPPLFFHNIIQSLRENIPFRPLSLLFWQNQQNIHALAAAEEEKALLSLSNVLGVKPQSKYFISGPFNNFSEAELHFRKALKEINLLKI